MTTRKTSSPCYHQAVCCNPSQHALSRNIRNPYLCCRASPFLRLNYSLFPAILRASREERPLQYTVCVCVRACMRACVCVLAHYCACVCVHAFNIALNVMCLHCSYNESCTYAFPAAVRCVSAPNAPANGKRSGSGTTFGSTLTYTCNRGYNPQRANRRTCMANGQWSGVTTRCSRKHIC